MSEQINWHEFNLEWRNSDPALEALKQTAWGIGRFVRILSWPIRHPHQTVKALEPWGILIVVAAFGYEISQNSQERQNRKRDLIDRSWARIETAVQANVRSGGGVRDAVQTLATFDVDLSNIQLPNIDLRDIKLPETRLLDANFFGAKLDYADFEGANLAGANFRNSILAFATLRDANIFNIKLEEADLTNADFSEVRFEDPSSRDYLKEYNHFRREYGEDVFAYAVGTSEPDDAAIFIYEKELAAKIVRAKVCQTILPDKSVCSLNCSEATLNWPCGWLDKRLNAPLPEE